MRALRRLTADKRVLAAVALLGLLLAGLGAYAIFREVLQARIEVRTGSFDFDIENAVAQDNEPENRDIAKCNANIADDRKSVQISISNAYPQYRCEISLTFLNDPQQSTIPGRFEGREGPEKPANWLSVRYEDPQANVMIDVGGRAHAKIIVEVAGQNVPENERINFEVRYTFRQFLPNP